MFLETMRCVVLVVYHSVTNHTRDLAHEVARGVERDGGCEAVLRSVNEAALADVESADALAFGSPVHYGNPSSRALAWVEDELGPAWAKRSLAGKPAAVFATGGGIHQGTESTLGALTRAMLAFGLRMVTPDVAISGYYSAYGASAVTGTFPGLDDVEGKEGMQQAGKEVSDRKGGCMGWKGPYGEFMKAAQDLGAKLAAAAADAPSNGRRRAPPTVAGSLIEPQSESEA